MNSENEQLAFFDMPKEPGKVQIKNCLSFILNELMKEKNVTLSQIQQATGIPWSTLSNMKNGKRKTQRTSENILALAKFFNVTIDYLCFGIGEDGTEEFNN